MCMGTGFVSLVVVAAGAGGMSGVLAEGSAAQRQRAVQVRAERQPVADLGHGYYRNPILPGNYPDASVVRVGADYYLTASGSGEAVFKQFKYHGLD